VKKTRGTKPNGKSFPRIVLFSPIAHEDTGNPNVPDGKAHNAQLEAYTKATEAAAKEAGVAFVDLFHPSHGAFQSREGAAHDQWRASHARRQSPARGSDREGLAGQASERLASMEALREAVVDKSYHWYQRYHASMAMTCGAVARRSPFPMAKPMAKCLQHELVDARCDDRQSR
jgi:hypothetical protein